MSQTKLPRDPDGGQLASAIPPVPLSQSSAWKELVGQEHPGEKNGPSCAGVRQHPTGAAIRSFALDQRVQESMLRKTLDNKATAPACPSLGEC